MNNAIARQIQALRAEARESREIATGTRSQLTREKLLREAAELEQEAADLAEIWGR